MDFFDLSVICDLLKCPKEIGHITGFCVDSKMASFGNVFFALKGAKVDGHDFIHEIALKGCKAAVVDQEYSGDSFGMTLLRVENVLQALHHLAKQKKAHSPAKVISVTGSVGKTSTKEFIAHLLSKKYRVSKTLGNANSQIGLPLSILNFPGGEDIWVLEMGMSEPGQISKLVQIAPPHIAIITKIGHAHISSFPTGLEGIAGAKGEIFSHPQTQIGVINQQALTFSPLQKIQLKEMTTFALKPESGMYSIEKREDTGPHIIYEDNLEIPFVLPFSEGHMLENFLAAAIAARKLGLSWDEIQQRARTIEPFHLRFEKIEKNGILFINDSYNSSPESMKAALESLPKAPDGSKTIGVFAPMPFLGEESELLHRQIGEKAAQTLDCVLALDIDAKPLLDTFIKSGKEGHFFTNQQALKKRLFEMALPGDIVLIKGGNIYQLWKLLE